MSRLQRARERAASTQVDLIPFMNLLAILIPVLLVSMHYLRIASIPAAMAAGSDVEDRNSEQLDQLRVFIAEDGVYVFTDSERQQGNRGPDAGPSIPKTPVDVFYGKEAGMDGIRELLRVWHFEKHHYLLGTQPVDNRELTRRQLELESRAGFLHPRRELDQDYPALQHMLVQLRKCQKLSETVIISAEPGIDYTTVVRVMDAVRYRQDGFGGREEIFRKVVLSAGVL